MRKNFSNWHYSKNETRQKYLFIGKDPEQNHVFQEDPSPAPLLNNTVTKEAYWT